MWIYFSLFFAALTSATLLPGSSEIVLSGLVVQAQHSLILLWCLATLGNVVGSCINYWLGLKMMAYQHRPWFPISASQIGKAERAFNSYGVYSLLLAWLPIIGDPLTLVGGIFRVPFWKFVLLVSIGKGLRYYVLMLMATGVERLL